MLLASVVLKMSTLLDIFVCNGLAGATGLAAGRQISIGCPKRAPPHMGSLQAVWKFYTAGCDFDCVQLMLQGMQGFTLP